MNLYLAPVVFSNTQLLEKISNALQQTFKTGVNKISLLVDTDSLYSLERRQYFSTGFIEQSAKQTTQINGKVVLITELDIYVPVFTFRCQLVASIPSFRLQAAREFYSGVQTMNSLRANHQRNIS
jgi:predicted Zn-dependent protease